jgi:hypothetical protein
MRNLKKILSLCLVLVLLVGTFSITAFAENDRTTYTVTIYLQSVSRDSSGAVVPGSTTALTANPVIVTVASGASYKDAIDAACAATNPVITSPSWTSGTDKYLQSLTVDGTPYANFGGYTGPNTYVGTSWMYFNGAPANIPNTINDYPSVVLSSAGVYSNLTFTLSYESMIYTW